MYKLSKIVSEVEGKKLFFKSYDLILKTLALKEDNWAAHKWALILLNSKTLYEGVKAQIKKSYNIKKHIVTPSKTSALHPARFDNQQSTCRPSNPT